jgi:predicted SnoaL-like aldol condensation-catalyzing enzyme
VVVEGDKLAARLRWHRTDTHGRTVERETIDILRFSDGHVTEHWGTEAWSIDSAAAREHSASFQS